MDASFLDVLHDAADIQLLAVEQRVDVDFHGILQELVDEQRRRQTAGHDGVGLGFLQCAIDVLAQLGVVVDNFHATAAEHVLGRTSTGYPMACAASRASSRLSAVP